jgi:hypothetical protein
MTEPEQPTPEQNLERAEQLLERLDDARSRLEAATDPDQAIEILSELSEIAKDVEAEIAKAKRGTDAQP